MTAGTHQFSNGSCPGNGHHDNFKNVCQSLVTLLHNCLFCFNFGLPGILLEHPQQYVTFMYKYYTYIILFPGHLPRIS